MLKKRVNTFLPRSVFLEPVIVAGAVDVNASNAHIIVPFNLDPLTNEFTVSMGCYFLSAGDIPPTYNMQLYSQQDGTGTGRSFLTSPLVGGNISSAFGGLSYSSGFYPNLNVFQWIHLVKTGTTLLTSSITFYRDTNQGATFNSGSVPALSIESATGNHVIGASKGLNRNFWGYIGPVRFFSRALPAGDIANIVAGNNFDRSDLEYEYLFTETSGTTCYDSSGNNVNGTLVNNISFNKLSVFPEITKFNGSRAKIVY